MGRRIAGLCRVIGMRRVAIAAIGFRIDADAGAALKKVEAVGIALAFVLAFEDEQARGSERDANQCQGQLMSAKRKHGVLHSRGLRLQFETPASLGERIL
jgi:hypothetical protein